MKIYDKIITIKKQELSKLKRILGVSTLKRSLIRHNRLRKPIKSIYIISRVKGKYRLRTHRRIYYDKSFNESPSQAEIKEGNIKVSLDVKKVYYDTSYCNERLLFTKLLSNRKEKNKVTIDVLYGGIGILGFHLIRIPEVLSCRVVDYNPHCTEWFFKSLEKQPKRYIPKIQFIESSITTHLLTKVKEEEDKTKKIAVCIAPLNKIPLKKILKNYDQVFYYLLLDNVEVEGYLSQFNSNKIGKVSFRKVKEYCKGSAIYLINIDKK